MRDLYLVPDVPMTPRDAAGWAARMASDQRTPDDAAAFERWSLEDPVGRAEYERMADLLTTLQVAGRNPAARSELRRRRPTAAIGRRSVVAACAAVAAGLFAVSLAPALMNRPDIYETREGETRRVALSDGTMVLLNVDSRMRVRMENGERRLWLDQGQARFEVAKDAARPFRVFAADREVRALGTTFDVRRLNGSVKVVLEEGSVALYTVDRGEPSPVSSGARPEAILRPGQAAQGSAGGVVVSQVDPSVTGAWRFGRLVLDNRPLGEAVMEINRYNVRTIVVEDAGLAAMPISGVFSTEDPEAFVQAVRAILPVEIGAQDGDVLKLERRKG